MATGPILLDEHVGRIFERLLAERGYEVEQAKDRFREETDDLALIQWCHDHNVVLVTHNAKDFEPLHRDHHHAGILLYSDQHLPDRDPEGLARTVDEIYGQYGPDELANQVVYLDEWYERLHG